MGGKVSEHANRTKLTLARVLPVRQPAGLVWRTLNDAKLLTRLYGRK
jgi:hypothetical protein